MSEILIRPFAMSDYEAAYALWSGMDGVGLSGADEAPAIAAYLARNPGTSFVAVDSAGALLGTILGGHDGRRGYIHHLAVAADQRRQGTGRRLVERCLHELAAAGIQKCHLFIYHQNKHGRAFWQAVGWHERYDIQLMSCNLS